MFRDSGLIFEALINKKIFLFYSQIIHIVKPLNLTGDIF
jgi:hypothetical protein